MSRWNLSWLLGFSTVAMLSLSLTYSAPSRDAGLQRKHENLKLFVDVLEEIQQKYVKELDADKMRELVENMINGGVERLDPHSGFINQEEYRQFAKQTAGKFGGIGIRISLDQTTGAVKVDTPMVGTPAYEAGVQAGDLILKVDGKATADLSSKKVVEMIQGEPGTKVTLNVLHEGTKHPVDIDIVRAEIKVDSVIGDQRMKDNLKEWDFWVDPASKIGYVRIVSFGENTVADLTRVVDGLQRAGMRGLVVDLRDNPGGLLRAAVEACSLFLPEGKNVVTTKGRTPQSQEVYNSKPNPKAQPGQSYPVAILINRYSASASEIVAAALQDHVRAVIIGERSYGKGSVQNVLPMENGASALKLTTASYWRPSGVNIHRFPDSKDTDDWGVKPSKGYDVKLTDEERLAYYKYRRERDIIKRNGETPKNGDKTKEFRDRVLDKGVEYIRGELAKQARNGAAPAPAADNREPAQAASERTNSFAVRTNRQDIVRSEGRPE
jgi:carboxyl-terminal processing protease